LNLPVFTPAERKVALFALLCAFVGSIALVVRQPQANPASKEKTQQQTAEIRDRLVKADHASAPRNRTGRELDLNAASEKYLARLPAMGPALARAVFQDRSALGPYASVSELARVKGIGPRRLKELSAFLYVMPAEASASASTNHPQGSPR